MHTYHFNTNIRCSACEAKIVDAFAKEPRIASFQVDLTDPNRPLEVVTADDLNKEEVVKLIQGAGYEAKSKGGLFSSLFGK
ncbi:MAG: heavy metal-associated domain-containing protein [Bacteroidota bacterium]